MEKYQPLKVERQCHVTHKLAVGSLSQVDENAYLASCKLVFIKVGFILGKLKN